MNDRAERAFDTSVGRVTAIEIQALRGKAKAAGDTEQVQLCDVALDEASIWRWSARLRCAEVVWNAREDVEESRSEAAERERTRTVCPRFRAWHTEVPCGRCGHPLSAHGTGDE